jgi:UDP-3-O-[3-hydroxymyristoyl] glucosamine N-acyltransferase
MQSQRYIGPKRIPPAANDYLSAAILDDGRHSELACAIEPNRIICAAVQLEECVAIPARAMAKDEPLVSGPNTQVNRPASRRRDQCVKSPI